MFKKLIITIASLIILAILAFGYSGNKFIPIMFTDDTWINDLGYKENQIHRLAFNWPGDRSCPEIPIEINNKIFELGFDTGCGVGIFFTDVIENELNYTLLGKVEALNRDGSHRGWSKRIIIDEFTVFGDTYDNIETTISNWNMYSSKEFNGTIGLSYFKSKIISLDYAGHRIAVSSNPINYDNLNSDKYVVLPLYKATSKNQEYLPFFEAEFNGEPAIVYLDTGKNYSYVYNPASRHSMTDKSNNFIDVPIKIGNIEMMLKDMIEINDMAQAEGLPFPTTIELNSDQLWKNKLLVTFDLIDQKIIFRRLPE
ncbi:hypothetical protein [Lutispora saccharofermentans]|uniref:Uncharacterized protein n=1 Tax=Lutispora saccharofermentans TaxID=3024236 RepID=A0ABT1NH26_9FIRM|nr:hypothetical protein [Lutispora saccharofermentans]MCQ1530379.1 hypothetical protein [Lutispora saccharofermentans]